MKTLSLKLDESIFQETEELLEKIQMPRNRYINEALAYYNRVQRKKLLAQLLTSESKMVSTESMNLLNDFDQLDEYEA
jgi:hypothetical protein